MYTPLALEVMTGDFRRRLLLFVMQSVWQNINFNFEVGSPGLSVILFLLNNVSLRKLFFFVTFVSLLEEWSDNVNNYFRYDEDQKR